MNVDCSSTSCYPPKRLKKEESVTRVNSRIVPVCCTILTYVHDYVNIVTVDYLLSCLVKLVKIYSFYSFFQYYRLFWYWWIKAYQCGQLCFECKSNLKGADKTRQDIRNFVFRNTEVRLKWFQNSHFTANGTRNPARIWRAFFKTVQVVG